MNDAAGVCRIARRTAELLELLRAVVSRRKPSAFGDRHESAIEWRQLVPHGRAGRRLLHDTVVLRAAQDHTRDVIVRAGVRLGDGQIAVDRRPVADGRSRLRAPEDSAVVGLDQTALRVEPHTPRIGVWRGVVGRATVGDDSRALRTRRKGRVAAIDRAFALAAGSLVASQIHVVRELRVGRDRQASLRRRFDRRDVQLFPGRTLIGRSKHTAGISVGSHHPDEHRAGAQVRVGVNGDDDFSCVRDEVGACRAAEIAAALVGPAFTRKVAAEDAAAWSRDADVKASDDHGILFDIGRGAHYQAGADAKMVEVIAGVRAAPDSRL